MPNLALFRQENGPFSPLTFGNMFSTGTRTSSITIWPVTLARRLNLPSITCSRTAVKGGKAVKTHVTAAKGSETHK